jgi:penicillin-binding protein 1A
MTKTKSSLLKRLGKLFLFGLTALVLVLALLYAYMQLALPNVEILKDARLQTPLRIFTADKKLMAEFGDVRRIPVSYDDIPPLLVDAVLATEDKHFFTHAGVDFVGLARAAVVLVTTGHKTQGGSTITMQVARNFFLSREKTYGRKFNEILLALKIDHELDKQTILALYFNKVFLGEHAYGFATAAQTYYGKPLNKLSLAQYAMLAGLPKAPSSSNPVVNPERAQDRRDHVLLRLYQADYINQFQYEKAINEPVTASYHHLRVSVHAPYVAELVRKQLYKKYGEELYTRGIDVYTTVDSALQEEANQAVYEGILAYGRRHGYRGPDDNWGNYDLDTTDDWLKKLADIETINGLQASVVTYVDDDGAQAQLADDTVIYIPWKNMSWAQPIMKNGKLGHIPETPQEVLKEGDVIRVYQQKDQQWMLTQIPQAESSLLVADPKTGAILAMVGGIDFNKSKFNRALDAYRQAGSSFKPFDYAAALNKGMTLSTIINDSPIVIKDPGEKALWRPQNDTHKFYGPTRLREGLVESLNLVSVRILQEIGINDVIDYDTKFGFEPDKLPHSLSLALGTADVTSLQLVRGFSVFANGGYLMSPFAVTDIIQAPHKVIYHRQPDIICKKNKKANTMQDQEEAQDDHCAPQVIDPQTAYLVHSVMKDVIKRGTGKAAYRVLKRNDLAGKTGTSSDQKDAWFVGYNQNVVAAAWVGFDDPKTTNEFGAQAALPIWIDFMKGALKDTAETSLPRPPGIITMRIDPITGKQVSSDVKNSMFELYQQGHLPAAETSSSVTNNNTDSSEAGVGVADLY